MWWADQGLLHLHLPVRPIRSAPWWAGLWHRTLSTVLSSILFLISLLPTLSPLSHFYSPSSLISFYSLPPPSSSSSSLLILSSSSFLHLTSSPGFLLLSTLSSSLSPLLVTSPRSPPCPTPSYLSFFVLIHIRLSLSYSRFQWINWMCQCIWWGSAGLRGYSKGTQWSGVTGTFTDRLNAIKSPSL